MRAVRMTSVAGGGEEAGDQFLDSSTRASRFTYRASRSPVSRPEMKAPAAEGRDKVAVHG